MGLRTRLFGASSEPEIAAYDLYHDPPDGTESRPAFMTKEESTFRDGRPDRDAVLEQARENEWPAGDYTLKARNEKGHQQGTEWTFSIEGDPVQEELEKLQEEVEEQLAISDIEINSPADAYALMMERVLAGEEPVGEAIENLDEVVSVLDMWEEYDRRPGRDENLTMDAVLAYHMDRQLREVDPSPEMTVLLFALHAEAASGGQTPLQDMLGEDIDVEIDSLTGVLLYGMATGEIDLGRQLSSMAGGLQESSSAVSEVLESSGWSAGEEDEEQEEASSGEEANSESAELLREAA